MILVKTVLHLVGIRGDAFEPGDIHKGVVPNGMGRVRHRCEGGQFFGKVGLAKTFIVALDVIVGLDAKDVRFCGFLHDLVDAVQAEGIACNAHIVRPG
jgi:hypothetical protein